MKIKCVYIAVLFACSLFLTGCRFHKDFGETTSPKNTIDEVNTEILSVLDRGSWNDDVTQCASNYVFETKGEKIYYHSECGTFNDITNKCHMTLSESERTKINQLLGEEPSVVKTYEETDREQFDVEEFFIIIKHYEMSDGTWKTDKYTYQYRLELTGRINNAASDSTFVYLSNVEEISFDRAWKAAGLSSNRDDYFDSSVAILVAMK